MAPSTTLHTIERQYRASLSMLREAVELCPESLWLASDYPNRTWHIAYHALFYTHLYLQPTEADFRSWPNHRPEHQYLGANPNIPGATPLPKTSYPKSEVLDYQAFCVREVEIRIPTLDLDAPSGFPWLPFNKLETQFYNIRHIQHHTAQLADRLRTSHNLAVRWIRPE